MPTNSKKGATEYIGAYFTLTEADRAISKLRKAGATTFKIKKRRGKFPLTLLHVFEVYADKKWW